MASIHKTWYWGSAVEATQDWSSLGAFHNTPTVVCHTRNPQLRYNGGNPHRWWSPSSQKTAVSFPPNGDMRGVIDAAGDVKEIWPDRGLIIRYYTGTFFFFLLSIFFHYHSAPVAVLSLLSTYQFI